MISVVVPIYNSEDTIAACIESIQRQTVTDADGMQDEHQENMSAASTRQRRQGWKGLFPRLNTYHVFLAVVGVIMLCLNLLETPTLSDDIIYRFMWNEDETAPVETISSFGDLLQSQWVHYLTTNGRWVVHLLAQAFLVFESPVVLQVLNALLFVLLLHLTVRWINGNRLFTAVMVFFLLFAVFQGLRTTLFWSLGTFNYLWTLVATLWLLLWLRKPSRCTPWLAPLAFFVGCSHEALSLPLSFGFFVYIILNRKQASVRRIVPYILCYWLGTLTILFSPGVWNRTTEGITLMGRLLSGAINLTFNMRIFWLLAIAVLVLWRRKHAFLSAHLRENASAYAALALSSVIVIFCGTNLERVCFFTDFIAMVLLLQILSATLGNRWRRRLMTAACVLSILLLIPAYMVRKENYDQWQMADRQMQEPGRELIAVRCVPKGDSVLMDYFRRHYVNPSIEFGFYCSYMAFDASDINMRCAARLYGKQRMTFLPEDVVRRIETDSTAYADYELSADRSLYVWRLTGEGDVTAVTFVLNPEDVTQLMPHQRLVAYRDDTFTLDDFNYEVVRVCGRRYLVFTRPTTNIVRRLNHIEIARSI